MTVKQKQKLVIGVGVLGLLTFLEGSVEFMMIGIGILVLCLILMLRLCRCPHCKKYLGQAFQPGELCIHCGEKLE